MADLEQQQNTDVMPTAGQQYAVDQQASNTSSGGPGGLGWAKTPRGILRIVEFIFGIVSFACMADAGDGWDNFSAFQYLVGVGVIVFIYTLFLFVVYTFRDRIERSCLYMPVIELAMDGILVVLLLAAGAAAAARLQKDVGGSDTKLVDAISSHAKANSEAAVVFTFFNMLLFIGSAYISYRENVAEEGKK